jgi:transposase-like protein
MEARVEMAVTPEDVQVAAKPRRRSFTAEYKRRILKEADACTTPGAVGGLLRREGLYSSHLVEWRRRCSAGRGRARSHDRPGREAPGSGRHCPVVRRPGVGPGHVLPAAERPAAGARGLAGAPRPRQAPRPTERAEVLAVLHEDGSSICPQRRSGRSCWTRARCRRARSARCTGCWRPIRRSASAATSSGTRPIASRSCSPPAAESCERQHIAPDQLTLHADRGPAMTAKPVALLLASLGVVPSHSRPQVRRQPVLRGPVQDPQVPAGLPGAVRGLRRRRGVLPALLPLVQHRASAQRPRPHDPHDIHYGLAEAKWQHRAAVLHAAYEAHPERFRRGAPVPPLLPTAAWINKPPGDAGLGEAGSEPRSASPPT